MLTKITTKIAGKFLAQLFAIFKYVFTRRLESRLNILSNEVALLGAAGESAQPVEDVLAFLVAVIKVRSELS